LRHQTDVKGHLLLPHQQQLRQKDKLSSYGGMVRWRAVRPQEAGRAVEAE